MVSNNLALNVGTDASIANDSGAYAILAYDSSGLNPPQAIVINNNAVLGVRSCGMYIAGCRTASIDGFYCSSQTDTVQTSLPKGAIAINDSGDMISVANVVAQNCAIGVSLAMNASVACKFVFKNITINDHLSIAFQVEPSYVAGNLPSVEIDGLFINTLQSSTRGVYLKCTSTYALGKFVLKNFNIRTTLTGVEHVSGDASVPNYAYVHMANGEIGGQTSIGLSWANCSDSDTRAVFNDILFSGLGSAATCMHVGSSYGLSVRDITFHDYPSGTGYCWRGDLARGSVEGIRYRNVAGGNRHYASGGEDLATSTPTWTGVLTDFIQHLAPTEAGSAASKYILLGWQWDSANSAWKQCRSLTGN
jgi:hypothetical protein